MYFENARKTRNSGEPTVTEGEPRSNEMLKLRLVLPRSNLNHKKRGLRCHSLVVGRVRVRWLTLRALTMKNKNGPPDARGPSNEPQMNRDVASRNEPPLAHEAHSKVPQFGAWNGGENVAYTACFDNARRNKSGGTEPVSVEPQLNHDIGAANKARSGQRSTKKDRHLRNASQGSIGSMAASERHGRQTSGGQSPLHPKEGKTPSKHGSRRGQNEMVGMGNEWNLKQSSNFSIVGDVNCAQNAFCFLRRWQPFHHLVWNQDPSQAEGFTGTFERAKVERHTPLHKNAPPSYQRQSRSKGGSGELARSIQIQGPHEHTKIIINKDKNVLTEFLRRVVAFLGFDTYDHVVPSSERRRSQKLWTVSSATSTLSHPHMKSLKNLVPDLGSIPEAH
ncbi:LOW QUALITY PROTEIN: hypothetical protein Cgig2_029956 [Carnegiea gigantea]|uniref:RIN4 pathogenic type III effector avirulence factor Avr cleavage site domain-containing protein n=1 Tax=Carnegiea gigantea TaxID=171969 RepID=A0A9Q1GYP1_9CARY|nr:LOW QUALITY PROTEIN: hypothetical protein Cgig2_029956 [Carnegiea gigantea]